jgi:hypothetical protein
MALLLLTGAYHVSRGTLFSAFTNFNVVIGEIVLFIAASSLQTSYILES